MKAKEKKNITKMILDNKGLILLILLFIVLTILVFTGLTKRVDELVSSFVIGIRNEKLTKTMTNITNVGGSYSLIVISLLLLIFVKKKKFPLLIICNLVSVFLTSQLLKIIFRRPRPDEIFLIYEHGFGYPSGHTMVSVAYMLFIIYLVNTYFHNKIVKALISILLCVLVFAIGFSRIYLGVHYFTDVLAGFFLGTIFILLFIKFIRKRNYIQ